jgi:protein-S-isoprenylcysteine O-methyltransferase Ste14
MPDPLWHVISTWADVICWGLFGLVWLAGAVYNARNGPATRKRSLGSYLWLPGVVIAWLAFRWLPAEAWRGITVSAWWVRAIGLVVLIAATAFTLWARGVLGTMWSSAVVVKNDHTLRTDGPYGITRHPIYTGILAMMLGSALLNGLGPWSLILVLVFVMLEVKIYSEERLLSTVFPAEYERYRRQVPQLIPGLRPRHH